MIPSEMLQANWIHPKGVEVWLRKMAIGKTLNVCCGMSRVGEVRVDIDPKSNRTVEGDLFNLSFKAKSFDTVICDPPFSLYNKFRWIRKLTDLAICRLLLSTPNVSVRLPKRVWKRSLWYEDGHISGFLRTYWCFDRRNYMLEELAPYKAPDLNIRCSSPRHPRLAYRSAMLRGFLAPHPKNWLSS